MWIKGLSIENLRCFKTVPATLFSRNINVFIGPNNSGKSTILKAIKYLQISNKIDLDQTDIRIGSNAFRVHLYPQDFEVPSQYTVSSEKMIDNDFIKKHSISYYYRYGFYKQDVNKINSKLYIERIAPPAYAEYSRYTNVEPNNIIYPYSAKRNVITYSQETKAEKADHIFDNIENIVAKFVKISGDRSASREFDTKLSQLLGNHLSHYPAMSGNNIGLIFNGIERINIEAMGDGVPHIICLLVDLVRAKDKIFLIEEIETNLHPSVIKDICNIINECSKDNQFFITTHSNIVLNQLAQNAETKIFYIKPEIINNNEIPTSTVHEISSVSKRMDVLEELGYDLADYNLWDGWIFLEESSAERIIREYLLPWFAKKVHKRIKTIACAGNNRVKKRFETFNNNFIFMHLTPVYKEKAWVLIDGDKESVRIIEEMQKKYSSWPKDHFANFKKKDFENYYPEIFKMEVKRILGMPNGENKQDEKRKLLYKVIDWIEADQNRAKKHFKNVASDIVEKLKCIEKKIVKT